MVIANDEETINKFNSSFKRTQSKIMMKVISNPTLAKMDFVAYDKNPFFHRPNASEPTPPKTQPELKGLHFGESIVPESICDSIEKTPLSLQDKASPMAWTPMLDFLAEWDYDKAMDLMIVGLNVSKEKWGNNVAYPLQKISTAYIDNKKDEIWVKIEFEPCVKFLKQVDDEDKDGYPEIYGLIDKTKYSKELLEHLKSKYLKYELKNDEIKDYFYKLSANWYEAIRTETLDMETQKQLPNKDTEQEIVNELKDLKINNATAIIRGEPFGSSIYNVFIVKREKLKNPEYIKNELQQWGGGSWEKWAESLTDFRQDIEKQLKEHPAEIKGFEGKDGFLFFRGSMEYLTSGDLRKQENERDPYPAIVDYKNQLEAKGIDFLLVIIPAKTEVFPDKISDKAPNPDGPYVTPYSRKLMLELDEAGVKIVDLLPAFIKAREQEDLIYMKQDTHWTDKGIQIAAKLIGDRIKQYSWYNEVSPNPISYKVKEVNFNRAGDIRGMLQEDEKIAYRPMSLIGHQVLNPDGSFYEDDESSPIVVLGDSFCGVFQVEDPKHAGLSAHIAKEIGTPVDLMVAYGSGPGIRKRLSRRGSSVIQQKKLVIWTTAARDLYNYWSPWDMVKVP